MLKREFIEFVRFVCKMMNVLVFVVRDDVARNVPKQHVEWLDELQGNVKWMIHFPENNFRMQRNGTLLLSKAIKTS